MAEVTPYQQDISRAAQRLSLPDNGNILVTGAAGLIGSCLVDILMRHTHCHVYAMGRNRQRAERRLAAYSADGRFHIVEHDISKPLTLHTDFQYIIHAASPASPNSFQQTPVEVMQANLYGVSHLADYGLRHGMQRMVYVSSGEVYGEGDGSVFCEQSSGYIDILSPRSCYPSSKRAAETLCAAYRQEYGADITIARPCHTYGPYFTESDNRVYAQFIRNILRGEDIVMNSPGLQYRSWLYVVDCAAAILLLLTKGESGQAYNIADEASNITIRQLAELTAHIAGHRVVMAAAEAQQNTTPITRAVFNTDKLRALGWQPLFTIEEGLQHTIETAQAQ